MKKNKNIFIRIVFTFVLSTLTLLVFNQLVNAQSIKTDSKLSEFNPLGDNTTITGISVSVSSLELCGHCRYIPDSGQQFYLELRRSYMLSSKFVLGIRVFTNINVVGFFDNIRFNGTGIGPILRYYILSYHRWQPYLQADFITGNDLNFEGGLSFYTGLKAGTTYRVTNTFGLFVEVGPVWEYEPAFNFEEPELGVQVGIQLYSF